MWSATRALRVLDADAPFRTVACIWRRGGHNITGVPPERGQTIATRLAEWRSQKYIEKAPPTDIGFPPPQITRTEVLRERLRHMKRMKNDPEAMKLARSHELTVDLKQVNDDWLKHSGPSQIKKVAEHYGIYTDLYAEGYFVPRLPMQILFNVSEEHQLPVYYGNMVKPREATEAPEVRYEAADDTLWTLILTNLDGNLHVPKSEYVHWCVSNIPGNNLEKGDTLVQYLQPIPPKGTGYHRYVFVLYKQEKKVDYELKANDPLESRTFFTREWYQKHQDDITPAGLAFFQSDWDYTLTDFYHNVLNMKEPIFEYDFDPPYIKKQEWFPRTEPFNLYLDKYRNPKDVLQDYLLLKMKKEHPFKKPDPPPLYPNAHPFDKKNPSWYNFHEKKVRNKWGRINDV